MTWFVTMNAAIEVGSPPSMRCMVPQLYATVGNQSCLGVLGHSRWPTVPGIIYPHKYEGKKYCVRIKTNTY
jgi:hypothetical protein